ncbi:putative esterase [Phytophthora citrophthora]|uniref:feruloyl esterase n=1 Tax=Phytophthora citrophthora TaxID=4793 RepID=A0AAD9LMP2_9STRA|nr:putative esterase [Phytophthora citrophthora]
MKIFGSQLFAFVFLAPVLASDCIGFSSQEESSVESTTGSIATYGEEDAAASITTSTTSSEDSAVTLAVVEPVIDCADLLSVDLTSIGGAGSNVTSTTDTTSDGVLYCVVEGSLPPAITWQVMLPVSTWTQRYMQIGCGGLCGSIQMSVGAADGAEAVDNGNLAMGATGMDGGTDGTFGLVEGKLVAFAYEAQHWTAEVAKTLIKTYYGQEQKYAYFNGCSDGGREAVMEALRYPNDFNGIIAGAHIPEQFPSAVSVSNTDAEGDHIVLSSRLEILHDAVVDACDALDGIEDGLLSDPRVCDFDVTRIQCASDSDNSTCLTSAEVEAVAKFYSGPIDAGTGDHLTVGEVQFASELGWSGVFVPDAATDTIMSTSTALAAIKYLIFDEYPGDNYTLADFDFANSTIDLLRARHPLLDSVSADLSAFEAAGGKLILWHGWADPQISPHTTIAYHEALQRNMGDDVVQSFERLYLLPGVYHCGDGEGPSDIDLLTPMMQWVEEGVAPTEVITKSADSTSTSVFGQWVSSSSSNTRRKLTSSLSSGSATNVTRPVYPYPSVAKYIGTGSVDNAANFEEGEPLYTSLTHYWLGQDFYNPYTPIEG